MLNQPHFNSKTAEFITTAFEQPAYKHSEVPTQVTTTQKFCEIVYILLYFTTHVFSTGYYFFNDAATQSGRWPPTLQSAYWLLVAFFPCDIILLYRENYTDKRWPTM